MNSDTNNIYKVLLDCHLANLYSFYFKLFKYEKIVRINMNKDISCIVNYVIGVLNDAIFTGEKVYPVIGEMPELSVNYLTNRSIIKHKISETLKTNELLQAIREDHNSIEKTLQLTIHYSETLKLREESIYLSETHSDIECAFKELEVGIQ